MPENDHKQKQNSHKPKTQPTSIDNEQTSTQTEEPISSLIDHAQHNASALSRKNILQLQRTMGNQAVLRLLDPNANAQTRNNTPAFGGLIGQVNAPALSNRVQREEGKVDPGEALPEQSDLAKARFANLSKMHPTELKTVLDTAQLLIDNFDAITQAKYDQLSNGLEDDGAVADLISARSDAETAIIVMLEQGFDSPNAFIQAVSNKLKDDPTAKSFANVFFNECSEETYRIRDQEKRDKFGAATGAEYAEQMDSIVADTPYLDKDTRKAFSDALKTMPTVEWLTNRDRKADDALPDNQDEDGPQRTQAEWKSGGGLTDNIYFADYVDKKPVHTDDAVPADHVMYQRVEEADLMLKNMIEPEVLELLDPPKVYVVRSKSFRAFQAGSNVHVSKKESMQVALHEVSHYLEDYLPTDLWGDIHAMMRARHVKHSMSYKSASKRDTKLTTVGHGELGMRGEGRYRGKYGTGKYTSSAYDDEGSTEFTSMTMEWLADPKKAVKLIEKDPQQAAIVLKNMRPNEYNAVDSLRIFDQYLPQKAD